MRWGIQHEDEAIRVYESVTHLSTAKSGFVIDPGCCWLGASPDRLVEDNDEADPNGLVEVKCPFSAKACTLTEYVEKARASCLEEVHGEVRLKRRHDYYYQVQGQMAICKRQWCDFVLWTPVDIFIERIRFDSKRWPDHFVKLSQFYMEHILPQL